MTRKLMSLLVLGTLATVAPAQQPEKQMFLKAGILSAFGDQVDFNGGKKGGHAFELGCDFALPDNFSTVTPWVGYARFIGNPRMDLQASQPKGTDGQLITPPYFELAAWRAGVDFKFLTPMNNLKAWVGINANFFDGQQRSYGKVPSDPILLPHPMPEGKAKLGARVGVDYAFTPEWSAHLQYDWGYFISNSKQTPRVKGFNPYNPSWFGLSVGYHF